MSEEHWRKRAPGRSGRTRRRLAAVKIITACDPDDHAFLPSHPDDAFLLADLCDVCWNGSRERDPLPVTPTAEQCEAWRDELDAWQDEPYSQPTDHYFAVIYAAGWAAANDVSPAQPEG